MTEPTTEAIAARAERLAQAREHWHGACACDEYREKPIVYPVDPASKQSSSFGDDHWTSRQCTDDHRTPAEQRADALDAAATLWAYFRAVEDPWDWALMPMYDRIQRTEVAP